MKHSRSSRTTYRTFALLFACLAIAFVVAGVRTSASSPNSAAAQPQPLVGFYYTVTSNADNTDIVPVGGTGTQADPLQMTSLRGAVLHANSTQITSVVGPVTIYVPASNGTYLLSVANPEDPVVFGTTAFNDIEVGSSKNHETTIEGVGGTPKIQQTVGFNDVFTTGFADAFYTPQAVKLTLKNLEITGGSFSGIFTGVDNSTGKSDTTIIGCNVHGNSNPFGQGGGIFNQTGDLSVQNSRFSNNTAGFQGGAIFYDLPNVVGFGSSGTFAVSGSDFIGNSAGAPAGFPTGGAILVASAGSGNAISVTDTNFENNSAGSGNGGAIALISNSAVSVTLSRFHANMGTAGSAIFNSGPSVSAINNWWGCDDFPGSGGCDTVSGPAVSSPRIDLVLTSTPASACQNGTTTLTADFTKNSANAPISPTSLDGETVFFAVTSGPGSVAPISSTISGAMATTTFTGGGSTATVTATLDNGTQQETVEVAAQTTATDPADQTVCQGGMATFSTTATGSDLHYAWTLDGSAFGGDTPSINVDTTELSIGGHTIGLTVTGSCGTVEHTATLTVAQDLAATDPADQTVCQGATASFSTTASGTGPFTYAWTVDGSPAGDTPSINVPTGSLSFGDHTVEVTVTGACGSTTQSATLTVQENASTTDPADQTVCEGATANFSTTASGVGPFTYAWTVNGSPAGGNSPTLDVDTTGFSAGNHNVSVTVTAAACGSATQTSTLTVNAPTATTDPMDQSVCEGGTAVFSTTASGTGPFNFVWKKGAMVLVDGDFGGRVDITSTATTSTLTISGAQPTDVGTYTVETTGACGTVSQSANLAVDSGPPVITTNGQTITLWPPNHKYSTFTINQFVTGASDSCDSGVDINDVVIASVTSDELDDNPSGADGSTTNDIVIAADCKSVQLRAERDSNLDGRVYTITFKVTDSQGNVGTATAKVTVPKNNNGTPVVDSGVQHTVNSVCP